MEGKKNREMNVSKQKKILKRKKERKSLDERIKKERKSLEERIKK